MRSRPRRSTGCTGAASGGAWPRCWVTTGAGSSSCWPSPWRCPARPSCCTATRSAWARTSPCPAASPSAARCNGPPGTPAGSPPRPRRTGRSQADGPYGYRTVNVLDQRHDPGSLYSWVAHAIQIRRQCPELGWGEWRTLKVSDPRVLAIETRWRDGCVVTLHNLSPEPATVRLPGDLADRARDGGLRQLLGDAAPRTAGPVPGSGRTGTSRWPATDTAGCGCPRPVPWASGALGFLWRIDPESDWGSGRADCLTCSSTVCGRAHRKWPARRVSRGIHLFPAKR